MRLVPLMLVIALCGRASASSSPLASHWMVTENGLIQPRENSPYELARPYDLLGFLNQDRIHNEIVESYRDLSGRQETVSLQWLALQQATDVKTILDTDDDCNKAGQMSQLNLYPTVLDSIRRGEITEKDFDLKEYLSESEEQPDCAKSSAVVFSMSTFEHLEAMMNRSNLTIEPDRQLPSLLFPNLSMAAFGSQISDHLKKNQSSWLHYTLASVYWKVIGNAVNAMECSRRAVYYAPRHFKDIALLSMGSIFLRSGKKQESQVVFSAAVDHAPQYALNHFALGNAHVLLGELNSSIACYDKCVEIDPKFEPVHKVLHLLRCHSKLLKQLDQVAACLGRLRANLSDYGSLEFKWWKQQALFLNAMKRQSHRFQDLSRTSMDSICEVMNGIIGLDFCSLKRKGDKSSLIEMLLESSEFPEHVYNSVPLVPLNAVLTLQTFVHNIEKQMNQIQTLVTKSEHLRAKDGKIQSESDYMQEYRNIVPSLDKYRNFITAIEDDDPVEIESQEETKESQDKEDQKKYTENSSSNDFLEFEGGTVLYPSTFKVNRNREDFDTSDEWPPAELCEEWGPRFPLHLDTIYPVFLPFENKGLRFKSVLSKKIGVTLHEEHPLPWHPPVCREVKGSTSSSLPRLPKSQPNAETVPVEHLRTLLLQYLSDGQDDMVQHMHEAEIGQRILTAYKKKVAPAWMLYTLSSLYWRVRRNNANALTCLASAGKLAPAQYKDIIHTSLASVLLEVGYVEEALTFATQAFRINLHEPSTNFLLSLIHMSKNNRMAHIFHMRQVVRIAPDYMSGLARTLLYAWSCKYVATTATCPGNHGTDEKVCFETGLADGQKITTCSGESEGCLRSSVQTFKHHGYKLEDEISTIVRLLDLAPRRLGEAWGSSDLAGGWSENIERRDTARKLRYIVLDNMLKNCGEEDCSKLYAVKATDVQPQSCFFQHLRFWYWLPYLRLENLLQERGIKMDLQLESTQPHTFPDCKAPQSNGDPTLEWLSRVDTENWRPVTDLVTEVTALLGKGSQLEDISAGLACRVQHKGSWLGLLVAGLWCGGFARGACCVRCIAAALHAAPPRHRDIPLLSLVAVLHLQDRVKEAKQAAYFALPLAPKNKLHLFVAGISHTYVGEYSSAIRMFRLALTQEPEYAVARACLQATMCLVLYIDDVTEAHK